MAVESQIEIVLSNGAKAGETLKELRKQAAALNREVNDLKPGTEEFVKKSADLQKVSGRMNDIRSQIKGTTEASNELKSHFAQYVPFASTLQKIGQNLGLVQKGVGGLNTSLGALRTALVSTGIGAIVVVLGLLINYLTSTQAGIDKLTAVTRPLQAILQRLQGVLQELGEKLFKQISEAIKDPRQAIIDLGNAIKENLISRFEALALFGPALAKIFRGEFADGFKDLGNAVIQVSTGIENGIDKIGKAASELGDFVSEAVAQGRRLDELQKAIERAEINRITRSKQLELVIARQKAIVEDETKTYEERRQAAQNALAAQQALLNEELSVLDKRIEKMKLEHSLNDTSREQEKELAELQAQRLEITARITEQSIEFNKKVNELNRAQAAEELAIRQNLEDLKIKAMQEGLDKEIAQINLDTERRIAALTGTEQQILEQEKLLEEIRQMEIQAIRDRYAAEQAEKEKKEREDRLNELIAQHELELSIELNALNERFLTRQITEQEYQEQAAIAAMDFQRRRLDIIRQAHGVESQEYQNEYAKLLQLQQAYADRAVEIKKKEVQDQIAAVVGALGVFGNVFGTLAGMQEQGTQQWKAFATAQAIMSTIQGSINAYTSTAAIPIVGPALAPVAAAIAFAAGMQSVRRIQQTKVEPPIKADRGMVLRGPSHAQGGIPVEAEGDEIILTKGVWRNPRLRRAASIINVLGGGRKFEAGGPINPLSGSDTSRPSSRAIREGTDSLVDLTMLVNKIDQIVEAQDRRVDRIRVINVVTDTEDGIRTVNQIREEADV